MRMIEASLEAVLVTIGSIESKLNIEELDVLGECVLEIAKEEKTTIEKLRDEVGTYGKRILDKAIEIDNRLLEEERALARAKEEKLLLEKEENKDSVTPIKPEENKSSSSQVINKTSGGGMGGFQTSQRGISEARL